MKKLTLKWSNEFILDNLRENDTENFLVIYDKRLVLLYTQQ